VNSLKTITALLKKDVLLEIRQQYSFYGVLLYVISTIFVLYLAMGQPEDDVWNGLFWMIQLFVCVNAVAKSFLQESRGRMLYFYSVAGPIDFILSKLLFNALLMLVMSIMSLLLFLVLMGNPLRQPLQFVGLATLGGVSLSLVFTFLAAIASKAQQQAALMAIFVCYSGRTCPNCFAADRARCDGDRFVHYPFPISVEGLITDFQS
jgi:heme exporter protein B